MFEVTDSGAIECLPGLVTADRPEGPRRVRPDDRGAIMPQRLGERCHRGRIARIAQRNGNVSHEPFALYAPDGAPAEAGVELLVTGSHGHRWLGDLFFGATTSGLRHRVRCPVLTVRVPRGQRR